MIDIRKRIFLIAGLVLLVVLLIFFLLFRKSPAAPVPTTVPGITDTSAKPTEEKFFIVNETPPPPPANPLEREKLYVVQLSKIFVERYMSYSNQADNGNITDVETLASDSMIAYIKTQTEEYSQNYKGVSTKVISSSLASFEAGKATVNLGIQQFLEEKGKPGVTSYKNGKATLVKSGTTWKIDGLFWDK